MLCSICVRSYSDLFATVWLQPESRIFQSINFWGYWDMGVGNMPFLSYLDGVRSVFVCPTRIRWHNVYRSRSYCFVEWPNIRWKRRLQLRHAYVNNANEKFQLVGRWLAYIVLDTFSWFGTLYEAARLFLAHFTSRQSIRSNAPNYNFRRYAAVWVKFESVTFRPQIWGLGRTQWSGKGPFDSPPLCFY